MTKIDKARAILRNPDRFMMLTHQPEGESFKLDDGTIVPAAVARQLQGDLFVRPCNDGLLPGFSQTFRIVG